MLRIPTQVRPHLAMEAQQFGFDFYQMDGEVYWDESAYYQFTLQQIENDLEAPTNELEAMCLELVADVVKSEFWLSRFKIPEAFWQPILDSWQSKAPSLYGRMDFSYDGKSPAKLLEYNADTPTSIFEAGFFQWRWLEQQVDAGVLNRQSDQFNSIQEALIKRFAKVAPNTELYFLYSQDAIEDKGTVTYLQDCAYQAGVATARMAIEDVGINDQGRFTDTDNKEIDAAFKLYPWEDMFKDDFNHALLNNHTQFFEPMWKAVLSNKAILPYLWQKHRGHPNLLAAYFQGEEQADLGDAYVSKPLFSREGANITWYHPSKGRFHESGSYGEEGYVMQAIKALPQFASHHTLIGSWVVGHQAVGLTIREDNSPITKDSSRFIPHIIL